MAKKKNRKRTQTGGRADPQFALPAASPTPEDAEARRARQIKEWEQRKKAKERGKTPVAVYAWAAAGLAVTAIVIALVVLLATGGSSDSDVIVVNATPDPRLGGDAPAQTVEVEAGDTGVNAGTFFAPNVIEGKAGEVIEIKVKNTGSSAHNMVIAGLDEEYGTRDDWITDPGTIMPGEEGTLRVKLNTAGSYAFECEFHPQQQTGTLILR